MAISDRIETFILELLKEDDFLEIGRNELASVFNCVPSQINYVISTRFGPEKGYVVESRRGGGGYLRIKRITNQSDNLLSDILAKLPESIDLKDTQSIINYLFAEGEIDEKSKALMTSATSEKSLPQSLGATRNILRAKILKNMLASLMQQKN